MHERLLSVITEGEAIQLAELLVKYPITIDDITAAAETMGKYAERGASCKNMIRHMEAMLTKPCAQGTKQ